MKAVKLPDAGVLRLRMEILFWRLGWVLPMTLVVVAACVVLWLFWVPLQVGAAGRAEAQLDQARRQARQSVVVEPLEPPMLAFQRLLTPQEETTAQLRKIFELAGNAGLAVAQVDMRRQLDAAGVYSQLHIALPVRGNYPALKRFCAEVLQTMPGLSIDQMLLKRDQAASSEVDAQLSLSLWQRPTVALVKREGGAR